MLSTTHCLISISYNVYDVTIENLMSVHFPTAGGAGLAVQILTRGMTAANLLFCLMITMNSLLTFPWLSFVYFCILIDSPWDELPTGLARDEFTQPFLIWTSDKWTDLNFLNVHHRPWFEASTIFAKQQQPTGKHVWSALMDEARNHTDCGRLPFYCCPRLLDTGNPLYHSLLGFDISKKI